MDKKARNILIGLGVVSVGAAVFGIAHHYTTKYLMKLAIDREGPKSAAKDKEKLIYSCPALMLERIAEIEDVSYWRLLQ